MHGIIFQELKKFINKRNKDCDWGDLLKKNWHWF